jgi:hypothetical protein
MNNESKDEKCKYVTCMGEIINVYKILVGYPELNRLLGRFGHTEG